MQHSHKLSSIGRLAAGVAHEINNPMAVINEKAGLMKDLIDYTTNFPNKDKFLSQVNAIIQSVQRCRTITHRLLGFARRMDVETEILDVNEVVKETLGFLEKEALHRNIKMGVSLAPDLSRISSDRGQLQQIFLNILNNAFAAVQDGGDISITTWERDLDTVGISIHDTGCGMSEEALKHIFEPFFTTKKGEKAQVWAFPSPTDWSRSSAVIWKSRVKKVRGPGSPFFCRKNHLTKRGHSMAICKLLLVDDEVEFVSTLAERLSMRGIEARTANNGDEALKLVMEDPPQVVILDLMMPGMSGLEVLQRIKSISPAIQVILLTGIGSAKDGTKGISLGAFDYLVKPLQIEELMQRIGEALKKAPGGTA